MFGIVATGKRWLLKFNSAKKRLFYRFLGRNDDGTNAEQTTQTEDESIATDNWLIDFINCYRRHPALWDKRSPEYRVSVRTAAGNKELLHIMRRFKEDATLGDVRTKICALRTHYRTYRFKVLNSRNEYRPRLYWYGKMSFLDPVLRFGSNGGPRPGIWTYSIDDENNNENDDETNNENDDETNNENDDETNNENDDETNNENDDETNNENDNEPNSETHDRSGNEDDVAAPAQKRFRLF